MQIRDSVIANLIVSALRLNRLLTQITDLLAKKYELQIKSTNSTAKGTADNL